MASELVEDPILRQRYRFSREGDVLRVELWAEPGACAPEHFHSQQTERWEIVEGEVTFSVDGEKRPMSAGERLLVTPGVRHGFENTGTGAAHLRAEAEPALELQEFLEDAAALSREGRFAGPGRPKGLRGVLEVAAFAHRYRETAVAASPPHAIQRILFPPLARLAGRTGKR